MYFYIFLSFYKQILANILLLCQIGIMTSYPVVDEGEQKQDVLNRDNPNSGVLMETNALQRNANSSDQRNLTLTSALNLFPAHARMARQSHPCVGKTLEFVSCDDGSSLTEVSCREVSFGCSHREGICDKEYTACTIKGEFKDFVTGCDCH